jgi:C2H2 transcription facotor
MSSTFMAVNNPVTLAHPSGKLEDDQMPSTPRTAVFVPNPNEADELSEDTVKTPTRESFSPVIGQKPLPNLVSEAAERSPDVRMDVVEIEDGSISPQEDHLSNDATQPRDVKEGSGGESGEGDPKLNKKKKSQRFFCTEYPPCKLSFTRSEHLARHIRYVDPASITAIITNAQQKTHGRATFPMSLWTTIFATR